VPRDDVISAHPIAHRGDPGWAQIVETGSGSRDAVTVKTVTVVNGGCVFDWVLVSPSGERFESALGVFDGWWPTFSRPSSLRDEPRGASERASKGTGS